METDETVSHDSFIMALINEGGLLFMLAVSVLTSLSSYHNAGVYSEDLKQVSGVFVLNRADHQINGHSSCSREEEYF